MDDFLTLDSHIDIPWPEARPDHPTRADPAKLLAGGIRVACYAAYIPQGPRTEEAEQAAFDRAVAMLHRIRGLGRLATTSHAIAEAPAGEVTVMPCVENGYAIGRDLGRLDQLAALGARYMTLTHNGHNALADSAVPRSDLNDAAAEHGGLSAFGRDAIARMNDLGMLVDISHASRDSMLQAAQASRTPVVATHSCARALCDHPRNLDDGQLDALRDVGGVIQITALSAFLKRHAKESEANVAMFVDHIDYAVSRIGITHVGISSDFDGGGGIAGWMDATQSRAVTAELRARGYDQSAIAALWGGNFVRLLRAAEAAASDQ